MQLCALTRSLSRDFEALMCNKRIVCSAEQRTVALASQCKKKGCEISPIISQNIQIESFKAEKISRR
jgi:hypothetical protein